MDQQPGQLAQLFQMIGALQAEVESLRAAARDRQTPRPRRRLTDPIKFNGKRYDTWEPLAKAVLRLDAEAIGDEECCFFWLYGNCESNIQAMLLPQFRDRLDLQLSLPTTYEEFVESLHTLNTKNAGTPFRQPNSQFQPSHQRFTPRAAPTPTPSSDAMDL